MTDDDPYIRALIRLHVGLDRLGPGDDDFTRFILDQLGGLPPVPRIADLGCGAGAGALLLAEKYRGRVKAVDFARDFLDRLEARAQQRGLLDYIEIIEADIGRLDWAPGCIDLLWSEGAAYNISFDGALGLWRPLLADGGIAMISELNYFSAEPPAAVRRYFRDAYPGIRTESANAAAIESSGFELAAVHRLPAQAWWDNYYGPLGKKISGLTPVDDRVMQAVIDDTRAEMEFFRVHEKDYGYSYYIMRATT